MCGANIGVLGEVLIKNPKPRRGYGRGEMREDTHQSASGTPPLSAWRLKASKKD